MARRLTFYFPARTLVLVFGEVILIICSFILATILQFGPRYYAVLNYENGLIKIGVVAFLGMLCMYYLDLYDPQRLHTPGEMPFRLLVVVGTLSLVLGLLTTLVPSFLVGNYVFLTGLPILTVLVLGWRRIFFAINGNDRFVQRTLILGDGDYADALHQEVKQRPQLGLKMVGYLHAGPSQHHSGSLEELGGVEDLEKVVETHGVRRIVVSMKDRRGKLPVDTLLSLKTHGVLNEEAADFYESVTGRVPLDSLRVSWLLFTRGFCPSKFQLFVTRFLYAIIAALMLAISLPFLAIVALVILIDTGRPILFRQKRVGRGGKIFTLYKFRSMRVADSADGKGRPAQEGDARITWTGRLLRKSRLDELPQLYNIFKGDMSFVGPRPFMVEEEFDWAKRIPFYERRWSVRPGATGWAQIHRPYCATMEDNQEKLSYDLFYIKNMSLSLDMLILFQTIKTLLLRRGGR